jgi:hypothetical protein
MEGVMAICPVCKGDCAEYVLDINGEIAGCDRCMNTVDADEYDIEMDELKADYHRETFMSDR